MARPSRSRLLLLGGVVLSVAVLAGALYVHEATEEEVTFNAVTVDEAPDDATLVPYDGESVADDREFQRFVRHVATTGGGWHTMERSRYEQISQALEEIEAEHDGVSVNHRIYVEYNGQILSISKGRLL